MDNFDRNILKHLQNDGRMSNLQLAERIHLSPPQTLRRVRTLEEKKIIRGYVAQVSAEAIGLGVMAFVSLSLDREKFRNVREVERNIMAFPDVIECHTIGQTCEHIMHRNFANFLFCSFAVLQLIGTLRDIMKR